MTLLSGKKDVTFGQAVKSVFGLMVLGIPFLMYQDGMIGNYGLLAAVIGLWMWDRELMR